SFVRRGQSGQLPPRAFLRFSQAGRNRDALAFAHHRLEQSRAPQISLIRFSDNIAREQPVARRRPPNLLPIRISRLVEAQFYLRPPPSTEFDFEELVTPAERGRVA